MAKKKTSSSAKKKEPTPNERRIKARKTARYEKLRAAGHTDSSAVETIIAEQDA